MRPRLTVKMMMKCKNRWFLTYSNFFGDSTVELGQSVKVSYGLGLAIKNRVSPIALMNRHLVTWFHKTARPSTLFRFFFAVGTNDHFRMHRVDETLEVAGALKKLCHCRSPGEKHVFLPVVSAGK